MKYERILYGEIQLEEELLIKNKIYNNMELEYYKIKSNKKDKFKRENIIYGIEIVKKEYINNKIKEEKEIIETLTKNEELVNQILEKLKNNKVTPTSLEYIITDWT